MTAAQEAQLAAVGPGNDVSALRVLLLEDSRLDEKIITAQLRQRGLECTLQRVDARAPFLTALEDWRPDIVLSDYNVPGFGGEDALRITRERHPDLPFLFVSGALGEHAAVELLKRGATDYVLKDRLERLVPSIERALRESREKAERLQAEERLRERERTLSTLMRNLPGMAFRARMRRPWYLDFASEGCLALTGYEPEAFRPGGRTDFDSIMHPDDAQRVAAEAEAAHAGGEQLTTTYRIRTLQGEERWVWVRAVTHPGPDGDAPVIEGFVTDITPQKLAEAEILRRIEFEQQLIGIVSHDLKNPLQAILFGATTLLKREAIDEVGTRLARRILASTERATRMINDLLDFTQIRLGAGLPVSPRDADLRDLTAQVLDEFEHTHPDRRLVFVAPPALRAWIDPGRVTQAVTNLVQNALTYSPRDTPVSIRLEVDGDDAVIEVHNTGEPIAPDKLADLFEPLRRGVAVTSAHTRSIGLGLFIVASIVR
ncbi:MAG TPA: PAS domain-containing protein, partial [Nannocystis sp.]